MRRVLRDRLVGLVRADVEIAERVARVPVARLVLDHAQVLRDGGVETCPAGAASPLFSACLRDRGPTISPRTRSWRVTRPSYQTAWAAGTSGGGRRNSRTATPRRGGRGWRSPCAGRSRSADPGACSSSIIAVARHLGHDRGGGNRRAAGVAVHDAALRHRQVGHPEGVDQDEVGQRRQLQNRALHRPQRRLVDVDGVDLAADRRRPPPRQPPRA